LDYKESEKEDTQERDMTMDEGSDDEGYEAPAGILCFLLVLMIGN